MKEGEPSGTNTQTAVVAEHRGASETRTEDPETALYRPNSNYPGDGSDAVCFTAGARHAAFGTGTVHAYLAARRPAPAIVAGISMGACNAAALQRAYQEWHAAAAEPQERREAARWGWYRRYVEAVVQEPLDVVWEALPDQSDFFADMPPIRDSSVSDCLASAESQARRQRYLLIKLGRWLARLPLRISLAARVIVSYVRIREQYPPIRKLASYMELLTCAVWASVQVLIHVCAAPHFFPEHQYAPPSGPAPRSLAAKWQQAIKRLCAWINVASVTLAVALMALAALVLFPAQTWTSWLGEFGVPAAIAAAVLLTVYLTTPLRRIVMGIDIVRRLGIQCLSLCGWLFSLINLAGVIVLAVVVVSQLSVVVGASRSRLYATAVSLLFWPFAVMPLCAVGFSVLLVFPETRLWLRRNGFMQSWPRPLFGWGILGGAWVQLVGIGVLLVVGARLVAREAAIRGVAALGEGAWRLLEMFVLPLFPAIAVAVVWWAMGQTAEARSGLRKGLAWGLTVVLTVTGVAGGAWLLDLEQASFKKWSDPLNWKEWTLFSVDSGVVWLVAFLLVTVLSQPPARRWFIGRVLRKVGLSRSVLHDYHLVRLLTRVFDPEIATRPQSPDLESRGLSAEPMPCLVVAASLQSIASLDGVQRKRVTSQLYALPGAPLVEVLRTAIAMPPLWRPTRLDKVSVSEEWLAVGGIPRELDLVDGAAIRANPLPALFAYLKIHRNVAQRVADGGSAEQPSIQVIYNVPLRGRTGRAAELKREEVNIVKVGRLSLDLAARRDTQMEVEQTNFFGRLEEVVREETRTAGGEAENLPPLFAGEIAPEEEDLTQGEEETALAPTRGALLGLVASGCKRSLERLYREELASKAGAGGGAVAGPGAVAEIRCGDFLAAMRKDEGIPRTPGLPEVCGACNGRLRTHIDTMLKSSERAIETLRTTEGDRECEPGSLATQFPQLTGGEPRIVFVASGGVFRGAFHIGMLGALTDCKIKPDLVVGASVGTLMGGALAAMTCSEDGGKAKLARLVMAFLHVDAEVALTQTFKGAARELGLRGRCVPLSPARVRRMILSGSQADPGYAVSGAPAALIDTFSDLFMIPHEGTRKIAADFVAGRVAASVARLLKEIERETLRRLRIEQAVVGTSLLDGLARELLGVESNEASLERQPFLSKGIAFFGTATDLGARTSVLLGGDGILPGAPYNIVEAALASSAFPCVFAPRSLSDIFPGIGSPTRYLADGGMFDNLPFFPAIGILSEVQRDYRASTAGRAETPRGFLRTRFENPDLLIAGALNTLPELEPDGRGEFETMAAIRRRATALQDNVKIRSFEAGSERVRRQVSRYLSNTNDSTRGAEFLDHVVHAAVLPVFPATREHLNGTFAFCRSMKLDRNRLTGSIANGCFETLSALAENQKPSDTLSSVAVRNLTQRGRIPRLAWRAEGAHVPTGMCPWFVRDSLGPRTEESETGLRSFECPFVASARKDAQVRKVYTRCIRDATHRSESRRRGQASVRRVAEEREAASAAPASKSEPDDTGVG